MWHHTYGDKNNYMMNKPASKCLKNNHKIKTVGEMNDYIKNVDKEPLKDAKNITA